MNCNREAMATLASVVDEQLPHYSRLGFLQQGFFQPGDDVLVKRQHYSFVSYEYGQDLRHARLRLKAQDDSIHLFGVLSSNVQAEEALAAILNQRHRVIDSQYNAHYLHYLDTAVGVATALPAIQ